MALPFFKKAWPASEIFMKPRSSGSFNQPPSLLPSTMAHQGSVSRIWDAMSFSALMFMSSLRTTSHFVLHAPGLKVVSFSWRWHWDLPCSSFSCRCPSVGRENLLAHPVACSTAFAATLVATRPNTTVRAVRNQGRHQLQVARTLMSTGWPAVSGSVSSAGRPSGRPVTSRSPLDSILGIVDVCDLPASPLKGPPDTNSKSPLDSALRISGEAGRPTASRGALPDAWA
mmetsp:Transcript_3788/g.10757  ORF Transcript_3788/g.10757 Transcript_3788/m.10757 type:complete len:228 (+) Transcript_3788:1252-1935(+)